MESIRLGGKGKPSAKPSARRDVRPARPAPATLLSYREALSEPLLDPDEEARLIESWQQRGDLPARDRLVASHMRLCYSVASRYDSNEEHIRDLAQEGVFGLMTAADRFKPEIGTRFATYARFWVQESVSRQISKVASVIDIPARTFLEARGSGIENEQLTWAARQAARGEVPLSAPIGDESDMTVGDLIRCTRPDPEAEIIAEDKDANLKRSVADAVAGALTPREAAVMRRRALAAVPETLETIATDLRVSRERIRQIEVTALGKLKRHLICAGFHKGMLR